MDTKVLSSGIRYTNVPENYIRPESERPSLFEVSTWENFTVIDLVCPERNQTVQLICDAHKNCGFFQMFNPGVYLEAVERMLEVAKGFFCLKPYPDDPSKIMRLPKSFYVKKEEVRNGRDYLRLHCYPPDQYVPEWPFNPPSFNWFSSRRGEGGGGGGHARGGGRCHGCAVAGAGGGGGGAVVDAGGGGGGAVADGGAGGGGGVAVADGGAGGGGGGASSGAGVGSTSGIMFQGATSLWLLLDSAFACLIPLLYNVVQAEYHDSSPFRARPKSMWAFLLGAICFYLAFAARLKFSRSKYSSDIAPVVIVAGSLTGVSLISALLPSLIALVLFAIWGIISIMVVAFRIIKSACPGIYNRILETLRKIPSACCNWIMENFSAISSTCRQCLSCNSKEEKEERPRPPV